MFTAGSGTSCGMTAVYFSVKTSRRVESGGQDQGGALSAPKSRLIAYFVKLCGNVCDIERMNQFYPVRIGVRFQIKAKHIKSLTTPADETSRLIVMAVACIVFVRMRHNTSLCSWN